MGWSTELMCDITFFKETYDTLYKVESKIEEITKCLQTAKNRIRDLVTMTEPNKFCPEEYDTLTWASSEYEENMELIEEYIVDLYKLELLRDNWTACHNKDGLAIDLPEGVHWDSAFLTGDCINTTKHPHKNEQLYKYNG